MTESFPNGVIDINKTMPNRFKKIGIIPSIISDHNGVKLEMSNTKYLRNFTNTQKLNNIPVNNSWVNEEIKRAI
jgi:hypothetical protein